MPPETNPTTQQTPTNGLTLPSVAPGTLPTQPTTPSQPSKVSYNGTTYNVGSDGSMTPVPQDPGFFSDLGDGDIIDAVKSAGNFAFPIIADGINDIAGTNQKTALQQLGDAGLSALWFIPVGGEGAEAAIRGGEAGVEAATAAAGEGAVQAGAEGAAKAGAEGVAQAVTPAAAGIADGAQATQGILSKLAGSNVTKGAAIGYGANAASQLAAGNTNAADILNPFNLGTLTGGLAAWAIPGAIKALGSTFTQEGAVQRLADNWEGVARQTNAGARAIDTARGLGFDIPKIAAGDMSIPEVIDGKYNTVPSQALEGTKATQLTQFRNKFLDSMGITKPTAELRQEAIDALTKENAGNRKLPSMLADLNKGFDHYQEQYGDNLTASQMEAIKEGQKYSETIAKPVDDAIRISAKTGIENMSTASGFSGMKELNREIQGHLLTKETLALMEGKTVAGGKLLSSLRGHAIGGAGLYLGSALGGGIPGALMAALAGEGGNALLQKIMGDSAFSNPLLDATLRHIAQDNPEIVQKLQAVANLKGIEGMGGQIAPQLAPKVASAIPGKLGALAQKGITSEAAQANANGHVPGQVVKGGDGNTWKVNDKGNYTYAAD